MNSRLYRWGFQGESGISPRIHMIAICGTGMGSLAGLLQEKGFEVRGSDANVYPPMSDQLTELGIELKKGFRPENIGFPDLVIIGNAVSKTNEEVQAVLERKIPYLSMPEAVGKFFLADRFPIVVAGTHGKTTTCSLLAWLLERSGQAPGFLVGGILKNFGRSYQLGSGDYFVIEGDEYDSAFFDKGPKFLHYRPQMLILNAVEFDHADIYRDLDHLMGSFEKLIALMPPGGLIVAHGDHPNVRRLIAKAPCRVMTFGFSQEADLRADAVQLSSETHFHLIQKCEKIGEVTSPLPGRHNILNLLATLGILLEVGIPLRDIQKALTEFESVKRRQEVIAVLRGVTVIDDFAHHPTAVLETLTALRARYPKGRLWAIIEPRSNTTRRKVFQEDFVRAFEPADQILIAPPYLIEKIPEAERLDPQQLARSLQDHGKKAHSFSSPDSIREMIEVIGQKVQSGDILCFMSNGSFGGLCERMVQKLKES